MVVELLLFVGFVCFVDKLQFFATAGWFCFFVRRGLWSVERFRSFLQPAFLRSRVSLARCAFGVLAGFFVSRALEEDPKNVGRFIYSVL